VPLATGGLGAAQPKDTWFPEGEGCLRGKRTSPRRKSDPWPRETGGYGKRHERSLTTP
jgi:hypothetical protein